jgi:molybdenum cofactor biosynthesis enzyme MoaA
MRKRGFMGKELFIKVIDDISSNTHFNAIYPFWLGESLMHRDFPFFFQYLMEKNFMNSFFECMEFATNGHYLTQELSKHILSFNKMEAMAPNTMHRIYLSIDSIDPTTYSKIRKGGNIGIILDNLFDFLKLRKEMGVKFPKLAIQMVVQPLNYDEITKFCTFFMKEFEKFGLPLELFYALNKDSFSELSNHGDVIFLRPIYTKAELQDKMDKNYIEAIKKVKLPLKRITTESEDKKFFGVITRKKRKITGVCHYLMTRPLITVEGEVLPCFNDEGCENSLGSLVNNSFIEVWNGPKARSLRFSHHKGGGIGKCFTGCNTYIPFEEPNITPKKRGLTIYPDVYGIPSENR